MSPLRHALTLVLATACATTTSTDDDMPPGDTDRYEVSCWLETPCEQTVRVGDTLHIYGTFFLTATGGIASMYDAALVPLTDVGQPITGWFEVTGGGYWTGAKVWITSGFAGTHRIAAVTMDTPGTFALIGRGAGLPAQATEILCDLSDDASHPGTIISKTCPDTAGAGAAWDPAHMALVHVVPPP